MVFVKSKTIGCYHMKIATPKRFKEDKKSQKYKEWKKQKDEEYDEKVVNYLFEEWWKKRSDKKIYKNKKTAKVSFLKFSSNLGSCKSYSILNF